MRKYFLLLFIISFFSISAQNSFEFEGKKLTPGSKERFLIPVQYQENLTTHIPVTVINGRNSGPVLGITAGVHGSEYVPIMAARAFANEVDPKEISGTIILVNITNLASFLERSVRVNPIDRKNINRSFPGNMEGSVSEKIAAIISSKIIARSDYFIDLHAGDANNDLMAYAGYYNYDYKKEVSKKSLGLAKALGFDIIVQFGNTNKIEGKSTYCSREAFMRGIPAADIECGRKGLIEPQNVERIKSGLSNVLKHLEISTGEAFYPKENLIVSKRESVNSNYDGFFQSKIKSGQYLKKGMKIGEVTDFFGETLEEIYAPCDGFVLYKSYNPPIKKDQILFSIAVTD
ncbi:succinylglutamate desuccinylase/aspartoacylase family protein [Mesonia aestuariivivens]|uniref:Succinylglutamate desuccinylase/aspartoacylase family protein n=1 Tax=Mesonia aestuariivivens TaxID=2796128 RepID=A0ABS6W175_9FLAO|nr:succinylglutamate desuccinylase/aspartoacylase family protein [Mesonia aestuariivivens]MBW2961610.1 succinylglutamate desuccinylase/aspartoacylase family protein [Mesonia aestuariivivens]